MQRESDRTNSEDDDEDYDVDSKEDQLRREQKELCKVGENPHSSDKDPENGRKKVENAPTGRNSVWRSVVGKRQPSQKSCIICRKVDLNLLFGRSPLGDEPLHWTYKPTVERFRFNGEVELSPSEGAHRVLEWYKRYGGEQLDKVARAIRPCEFCRFLTSVLPTIDSKNSMVQLKPILAIDVLKWTLVDPNDAWATSIYVEVIVGPNQREGQDSFHLGRLPRPDLPISYPTSVYLALAPENTPPERKYFQPDLHLGGQIDFRCVIG